MTRGNLRSGTTAGCMPKWRRDWWASVEYNRTALDRLTLEHREGEPAAWNLGIAATALREWPTARLAWSAFGISLPDGPDEQSPIEADFGQAPVRLNAEPRFAGEAPLVLDGRTWDTEVVWGRRLCPTRIRIENVPTPVSGHRFAAGGAAEDWTQSVQVLCRACSQGSPHSEHHHPADDAWSPSRALGLGGDPDQVRLLLDQWAGDGHSRSFVDLDIALH